MTPLCSFCPPDPPVAAISSLRLIPRRTDQPACAEIARALVWPNVELPTTVSACAKCRPIARQAARTVMAETPLGDAVVTRTMRGGVE